MTNVQNVRPGARSGFGEPLTEPAGEVFEDAADSLDKMDGDDWAADDQDADGTGVVDSDDVTPAEPGEAVPYDAASVGTLSGEGRANQDA